MKMWRFLLIVLSFLGFHLSIEASTGKEKSNAPTTVRVKLIDPSGQEIPGAKLELTTNKQTFISDMNGFVTIQKTGVIEINALGFMPKTISSNTISNFSEITLTPIN